MTISQLQLKAMIIIDGVAAHTSYKNSMIGFINSDAVLNNASSCHVSNNIIVL